MGVVLWGCTTDQQKESEMLELLVIFSLVLSMNLLGAKLAEVRS